MKLSFSRELLIFCLVIIASGALLPGVIYIVGGRLFGAYSATGGGMPGMYRATLADLTVPTLAAWIITLCPALCVLLLRLLFGLTGDHATQAKQESVVARREPTIGG